MSLQAFIGAIPDIAERAARMHLLVVAKYQRDQGQIEFSENDLRGWLASAGVPPVRKLKDALKSLSSGTKAPMVKGTQGRYGLSIHGVAEVEEYLETVAGIRPVRANLSALVGKLTEPAQRRFLAEAIACVQVNAKRAATVMCWALTVDHLQEYTLKHKLNDFNIALGARTDKWAQGLTIKAKDDFSEIPREDVLIQLWRAANVITNDVRKIMDAQLGFRNTCGHPSTVEVPESKVLACIEDLVENVIVKYPL